MEVTWLLFLYIVIIFLLASWVRFGIYKCIMFQASLLCVFLHRIYHVLVYLMEWICWFSFLTHLSVYSTYHMVSTCGGSKCSTTLSSPWTPKTIFRSCYKLAWNPCKLYFKYIWCTCWSSLVSAYSFWILPLRTTGMCYWKWKCPAINWKSRNIIATWATVMVTIFLWFSLLRVI